MTYIRLTVRVSREQKKTLRKLARIRKISESEIVRQALASF
jgi:predicted transcriptional regulator